MIHDSFMATVENGGVTEVCLDPAARAHPEDAAATWRWVIPVWSVVVVFAVITVVRSVEVGIPLRDPHGAILRSRVALSLALFAVLVPLDAAVRARRRGLALRGTGGVLRAKWTQRRLALALTGLLAYHLVYFCYHNLKSWDVFNRPRDQMLLEWDRWLFLGHSPAVLLHGLLGTHVAAYVLMVVYESFSTLVSVAVVAAVVVPDRMRDGYVAIASGLWIWILGTLSYYAIPSLGPFHGAPAEFANLPHTMIQDTQHRYMAQRAHLLAHPQAPGAFAQVSAFASLHIGVLTVVWLLARYHRLRWVFRVLAVDVAVTCVATVYLGWHFFVDDLAGLLIGFLAVALGTWMIRPGTGRLLPVTEPTTAGAPG
jgi:membrane-associated phospholipid phosphatase